MRAQKREQRNGGAIREKGRRYGDEAWMTVYPRTVEVKTLVLRYRNVHPLVGSSWVRLTPLLDTDTTELCDMPFSTGNEVAKLSSISATMMMTR